MKSYDVGKELELLLQILKNPLAAFQPVNPNTDKLIRFARIHRVNYQLLQFAQLHPGLLSVPQVESLASFCRNSAMKTLDQLNELLGICDIFSREQISFAVIKGPHLSRMIYGRESMKESLDLDILLVHSNDLDWVHELLKHSGYTRSNLNGYPKGLKRKIFLIAKREVHFFNPLNKIHIDLHLRPGANTYLTAKYFRHVFDSLETDSIDGHPVPVFAPEQYLAYLCYHGSLHQYFRLGWLMDIRAFIQVKGGQLDFSRVIRKAREMHAQNCLILTFALLHAYFNDPIPAAISKISPDNPRFRFLIRSCIYAAGREAGQNLTLAGRWKKLRYMMVLLDTWKGRVDVVYGIFVRMVANVLREGQGT